MDQFTIGRIGVAFGTVYLISMVALIIAEIVAGILLVTQRDLAYIPALLVSILFFFWYKPP